jgi:cell division septal protein FtsQ
MTAYLPLARALLYLSTLTCCITGSAALYFFGPHLLQRWYAAHPSYSLTHIRQQSHGIYKLPAEVLVEILELNFDHPLNLYAFDLEQAAQKLTNVPVFKQITLTKEASHTLSIDYTLRTPMALVIDYSNTAIDTEGVLMPLQPYYPSIQLPCCLLGMPDDASNMSSYPWNHQLPQATTVLLQELLSSLKTVTEVAPSGWCLDLRQVDSFAIGEIALFLKATATTPSRLLRLTPGAYQKQLNRYGILREKLMELEQRPQKTSLMKSTIVDLRLADAALIAPVGGDMVDDH